MIVHLVGWCLRGLLRSVCLVLCCFVLGCGLLVVWVYLWVVVCVGGVCLDTLVCFDL